MRSISIDRTAMSPNRIAIFVVVAGYLFVNARMQNDFFAGRDIFAKYQVATSPETALHIAQEAYFAKTSFLLILIILQAFSVPFGLALGLSFVAYAVEMLVFFGFNTSTTLYLVGGIVVLASYFVKWPQPGVTSSRSAATRSRFRRSTR